MSGYDLDAPLWLTGTIAVIAWGTLGIVCLVLCRRRKGDHHDRAQRTDVVGRPSVHAAADWSRNDHSVVVDTEVRRAEASSAARVDDGVHRDRGSRSGDERNPRAGRSSASHDLQLLDDEVVALARWFAIGQGVVPHTARAVAKIERAAADIINAQRAARR